MRTTKMPLRRGTAGLALVLAVAPFAAARGQTVQDLRGLSIEQLANVEVTSASKRSEPLSKVPAALFVISGDDIRRSTASSLPEVLRLAPNLNVQRIDAQQYSVSARGFAGYETSNKLLVLIDGRSVYSSIASGVVWDLRQLFLEDLERVEVISGPGGTLYGANAVNGVVNVLSKNAFDTQGGLVRAEGGPLERTGGVRYGGTIGGSGAYRLYVSGHDRDGLPAGAVADTADGGEGLRGGFRTDWATGVGDMTVQGDLFTNDNDSGGKDDGHNLLARWTRNTGAQDQVQVQAYYDSFSRSLTNVVEERERSFDVAAQANLVRGSHKIVVGGGLRAVRNRFTNLANPFRLDPEQRTLWIGNVFVQDSVALGDQLTLTGGVKLEGTTYAGAQLLPNARLGWQIGADTLLWAAVSRAIRTPSRIDRDLVFPGILLAGTFEPEKLTAIEAGYRGQPTSATSLSISVFYNLYDDLRTTSPAPDTIFPVRLANGLKGHSYGIEAWGSADLTSWWRMSAGFSVLHKSFRLRPGESDLEGGISLGNDPDYQAQMRSQMTLARGLQLDVALRAVDSLPNPAVDSYIDADARIGWQVLDNLELSVSGMNLFNARRDESADTDRGQLVRRSVLAGLRVMF